ncbi:MAG: hypothetical protein QG577_1243 [Thermodesulfobacteriota bacterium]|nr:hypothetical protein [Thermodesulfobacteriota bacterium]
MTKKKVILASSAIAVLVVGLVWMQGGFHRKVPGGRIETKQSPGESVKTATVEKAILKGEVTVSGTVGARDIARIASRINGYVIEIKVDAGDRVREGGLLLKIDTREFSEREAQAAATLESAKADLLKAKNDFERYKILFEKESVSKKDYDDALAKYDMAVASETRAKAALEEAKTMLSYGIVTAPFDGIVSDRNVNVGDSAGPGRNLISVYRPESVELVASAGEQYALFLVEGTPVSVDIPSLRSQQESTVREVVPQRDEKTRTVIIKAPLKDIEGLVPGLYGTMTFRTQVSESIAVPRSAVRTIGQLEAVKVLEGDDVRVRHVKMGRSLADDKVEIISGLQPGEKVVLE